MSCLADHHEHVAVLEAIEDEAACRWCGDPTPDDPAGRVECPACSRFNAPAMLKRIRQALILVLLRRRVTNRASGLVKLLSNGRLSSIEAGGGRPGERHPSRGAARGTVVLVPVTDRVVRGDLAELEAAGLVERTGTCPKLTQWWALPVSTSFGFEGAPVEVP